MSPHHHLPEQLLIEYAAGTMPEPVALLVATHLALCPDCRAQAGELDAIGGALLEAIEPVAVDADSLDALLARLDDEPMEESRPPAPPTDPSLPEPLRSYLGQPLSEVKWQGVGGMGYVDLGVGPSEFRTRLMRIAAGTAMPQHSHTGNELTLVLTGGFSDADGHYLRGDVAITDSTVDHRPVADADDDCLCLAVTDAPLKLTGPIGRMLNPLFRF